MKLKRGFCNSENQIGSELLQVSEVSHKSWKSTIRVIIKRLQNMTCEELEKGFEWATVELGSAKQCAMRIARAVEHNYAPEYIFKQNMQFRNHVVSMYGK